MLHIFLQDLNFFLSFSVRKEAWMAEGIHKREIISIPNPEENKIVYVSDVSNCQARNCIASGGAVEF